MTSTLETPQPDLGAVKRRQQQVWSSGDFHEIATLIQPVADSLVHAVDVQAGWRVLDVACGSGNAALAATRYGAEAYGIDYVPALLARGRRRAEAEGVTIEFLGGDAEAIPFPDGSFDAVLSVFGSMFAPDHARAASELARVARPGGTIGLATWTPDGFIGELLKVVSGHVPPPPGVSSPILWGTEPYLTELFGDTVETIWCTERVYKFRYRSPEAFVDHFRTYYGPTVKAFEAVGEAGAPALFTDLIGLVRRHVGRTSGPVAIPATYLETVAIRA